MPWHTVLQGEWLCQIARKYGFPDVSELYNHDANADLKRARPDPNLLLPGDRVFIPEKSLKEVDAATGRLHRYEVKTAKCRFKVVVHDEDGTVFMLKSFKLKLGGTLYEGTSGGDGLVEVEIPSQAVDSGELEIEGHTIPIRLGHLDPLDEVSGVKARLHNLGYDCGPIDHEKCDALTAALRLFQKLNSLKVTGDLDGPTRSRLKEVYGC